MPSEKLQWVTDEKKPAKKPYSAPQLVEHGSIEDITGTPTGDHSSTIG